MNIVYARDGEVSATELAEVFKASGIRRPFQDLDRMARMIAGASLLISARHAGRLVGVARSLTDFCYACYLSDLAVDAAYQRRGIGKELIRQTQLAIGNESMILLIAAPEAMAYYPQCGFVAMDRAWYSDRKK